MHETPLLAIEGLDVGFPTLSGVAVVVRDVNLSVGAGEIVGLVGESGSGKSVTCRAVVGLVPEPGAVLDGRILLDGRDLAAMGKRELRRIRGRELAMVFQDPMSSLNPVFTVGHQIVEVLTEHGDMARGDARTRARRAARARRHPVARAAVEGLPARALGRDATARDDRHRAERTATAAAGR